MVQEIKKFKYIDALRGIAILGVLMVHTSQNYAPSNPVLQLITSLGSSGVQLFFIASALTLSYSWNSRLLKENNILTNFFIRRFLRIAPLFWFAIIFYTLLFGLQPTYFAPNGINWWSITSTALFLHGLHPETISAVVPGGWSIAVEMTFYLFFPFLITKFKNIKLKFIFLIISLLFFPIMQFMVINFFQGYSVDLTHDFILLNIFGQLSVFAIGLLSYEIIANYNPNQKSWIYSIAILFLLMLLIFIFYPFKPRIVPSAFFFSIGFGLLSFVLSKKPITILVNRFSIALGKYSFSMYISHFAIIHFFLRLKLSDKLGINNNNLIFLFLFGILTLVTFFISKILYRIIEKPGIDLGKKIIQKYSS